MKSNRLLNDIFNALRTSDISCVINKNDIIETAFNSFVVNAYFNQDKLFVYFRIPVSLSFTVINYTQRTYIDVHLDTDTLLLDNDKVFNIVIEYSQKWHHFNKVYTEYFKSRIQSINDFVANREITAESLEYLQANRKLLENDYDMLSSISKM